MTIEDDKPEDLADGALDDATGGSAAAMNKQSASVKIAKRPAYTAEAEDKMAKAVAPTPGIEGTDIGSGG